MVGLDRGKSCLVHYQSVMKKQVTVAEIGARIRGIRKSQGALERGKATARLGEVLKVLRALGRVYMSCLKTRRLNGIADGLSEWCSGCAVDGCRWRDVACL